LARGTRPSIVARTAALASAEGLDAVTLGRLARELEMSKAGVIGHFGSMEALQVEAVGAAADAFREHVWEPAAGKQPGLPRLRAICDRWLAYVGGGSYVGGCLTSAEMSASAAVRDAAADAFRLWRQVLGREVRTAIEHGELAPGTEARDVVFEIGSIALGAAQALRLGLDRGVRARARRSIERVLASHGAAGP
jgi:AcrR family transcriptional regulator